MKKTILLFILLTVSAALFSQVAKSLILKPSQYRYYCDYSSNPLTREVSPIINLPVKPFSFKTPNGVEFKSSEMIGKVIVLDFWATWCVPCRKITKELDSLLKKYVGRKDYQMIGVDYNETKTSDPVKYWNEHGYLFPMTINDNEYGKSIGAFNPTVVVIDQDGIVKGKWDGWTTHRTEEISVIVWALLEKPTADIKIINSAIEGNENIKALHLIDMFLNDHPNEREYLIALKFHVLKHLSAIDALVFIKPTIDTISNFESFGKTLIKENAFNTTNLTKDSLFEHLLRDLSQENNSQVYELLGRNYYKSGKSGEAINSIEKAIKIESERNFSKSATDRLCKLLDDYKKM